MADVLEVDPSRFDRLTGATDETHGFRALRGTQANVALGLREPR
jgi:hypothetical protein